jgi:hypothetical protein
MRSNSQVSFLFCVFVGWLLCASVRFLNCAEVLCFGDEQGEGMTSTAGSSRLGGGRKKGRRMLSIRVIL